MNSKQKFALIKWVDGDNKFDVVLLNEVINSGEKYIIDRTYKVKYNGRKYDAILKLVGTKNECDKQFENISNYDLNRERNSQITKKQNFNSLIKRKDTEKEMKDKNDNDLKKKMKKRDQLNENEDITDKIINKRQRSIDSIHPYISDNEDIHVPKKKTTKNCNFISDSSSSSDEGESDDDNRLENEKLDQIEKINKQWRLRYEESQSENQILKARIKDLEAACALTDRKAYLESSKIFIRAFGTQSDVLDCSYQDDGDSYLISKKFPQFKLDRDSKRAVEECFLTGKTHRSCFRTIFRIVIKDQTIILKNNAEKLISHYPEAFEACFEYVKQKMPNFNLKDARRALRELHNEYVKREKND